MQKIFTGYAARSMAMQENAGSRAAHESGETAAKSMANGAIDTQATALFLT